ncbi:MAG: hypothetical protein JRJ21_05450, partial [Deltaproteobacteria bacterium]|nr:hypothetical protein [Deltaproteobacteria bacterium]
MRTTSINLILAWILEDLRNQEIGVSFNEAPRSPPKAGRSIKAELRRSQPVFALGLFDAVRPASCRAEAIASDAEADPDFAMMDLANLQRKARIDLGINIEMHDKEHLRPDPDTKYTPRHYLLGTIQY